MVPNPIFDSPALTTAPSRTFTVLLVTLIPVAAFLIILCAMVYIVRRRTKAAQCKDLELAVRDASAASGQAALTNTCDCKECVDEEVQSAGE